MSYLPFLVPADRLSDFGTGELLGEASLKKSVNFAARGRMMQHQKRLKTPQAEPKQPEVKHEIQILDDQDDQSWERLFNWWKGNP